jgi:hypothetical protein
MAPTEARAESSKAGSVSKVVKGGSAQKKTTQEDPDELYQTTKKKRTKKKKRRSTKPRASRYDGLFFDLGLGYGAPLDSIQGVDLDGGFALSLGLGFRVSQIAVGVDFLFNDFNMPIDSDNDDNNNSTNSNNNDDASSAGLFGLRLSLQFNAPIDRNLDAYGLVGLDFLGLDLGEGTDDAGGFGLDLGGGIEYHLSRAFSIGGRVTYTNFLGVTNSDDESIDGSALSGLFTLRVYFGAAGSSSDKKEPRRRNPGPAPKPRPRL